MHFLCQGNQLQIQGNATFAPQHFRPTVLPSYDTSDLRNIGPKTAVGRMYILFCSSDLSRNCRYFQNVFDSATGRINVPDPVPHKFKQVRCTLLVNWMHNLNKSDAQLYQVRCTTLVGRIYNFRRSDAQLLLVGFSKMTKWGYG